MEMAKGIQREIFAHATRSLAHVTQHKWGAQLFFLNQECEKPSSVLGCHPIA
jgi:hypothetical protein